MDALKAVTDTPDPKKDKSRPQSGVSFPYFDLESSVEVARTLHQRAGGRCDMAQLATLLNYSGISNGSFRSRLSAAKMFGFIGDTEDKRIQITSRGRAAVAPITPQQEARARVDAFLNVELFRLVFERFNGSTLPEQVGLKNLFETEYRVVSDRIGPTIRIMLDSAEQAGFFSTAGNRTRMVMPLDIDPGVANPAVDEVPPPRQDANRDEVAGIGSGGGGNGGGRNGGGTGSSGGFGSGGGAAAVDIDPAILGLLQRLPPGGTPLSEKRRKSLIDAFTATVAFIYPDADEG